ncbi:MAG TPA: alpha/beta fold hydrolase [Thermodesulfobacteriota bacterium]|nr:alpha/beta fold hydrolase [Thermodesulfobacteriota bacterium]
MNNHKSGKVKVNDVNIYHEIHGEGKPLLLIEGLGYSSWMWFKQIPALSRKYKVIVFDNRGVGNTDKPDREYTMEIMADDAAGLLKALGIDSAHVLGVSMGGFIAQELALKYPDMVRGLVLVSTSFGGEGSMPRGSNLWNTFVKLWGLMPDVIEFSNKGNVAMPLINSLCLTPKEKIRYGLSLAFTPEYFINHPGEIDRIVERRLADKQPSYAWKHQLIAGMNFYAADRVHRIKAPTLVITGSEDRVVPPERSKRLAEEVPNSRFITFEETGHLLFIERAEEFNEIVLSFLQQLSKDKEPEIEWKEREKR